MQACPLRSASVPCFLLKHSPPFPHASPIQELPRAGRGCEELAVAAKGLQTCQGLLRAGRGCQGWQGLPRAGMGCQGLSAVFPTMTGILTSRSRPCAFSSAVRKRKGRNSLEAEARRIANVDFCLEVRVKKVRVNKLALITSSWIRGPKGGRGALARPSPPPSFAHSIHSVWPAGTQYNARVTFTHFCTFVFLPSANSIIFAKRGKNTNGFKWSTQTQRKQHLRRPETSTNGVQTSTNGMKHLRAD